MTNHNSITKHINTIIGTPLKWARSEPYGLVARIDLAGGDFRDLEAAAKKLRAAGLEAEAEAGCQDGEDDGALYLRVVAPTKSDVVRWETILTFDASYPDDSDDGEGTAVVEVQIGAAGGLWYLRTRDDAGGSDDARDAPYASEALATEAAEDLADRLGE